MPALVDAPNSKPNIWAFNPALTARGWRWFWDSCLLAFPMWRGAGSPAVYGKAASMFGAPTLEGGQSWVVTEQGLAVDFVGAATGQGIQSGNVNLTFADIGLDISNVGGEGSIFIQTDKDAISATGAVFGGRSSTPTAGIMCLVTSGELMQFTIFGVADHPTSGAISPTTGPMSLAWAWRMDDSIHSYQNGVLQAQSRGIGIATDINGTDPLGVFCWFDGFADNRLEAEWDGRGEALYIFDRKHPVEKWVQLHDDPHGPFRMDMAPFFSVGEAAAAAAGNVALLRRRRAMIGPY